MMKRRTLVQAGIAGSAGAVLGLSGLRTATAANGVRPLLTPFLHPLPAPPEPRPIDWSPNQLPFSDLDTNVLRFVDPSQARGKATFYRVVSEVRSVKFHSQLPATEIWGYRDGNLPVGQTWPFALGPTFRRQLSNDNQFVG